MASLFSFLSSSGGGLIVGAFLGLATWTYHKVKGDKVASFDDVIRGIGKTVVDSLVRSGDITVEALTSRANALTALAMARLGIPKNALTDSLVAAMIQHAVGDALEELRKLQDGQDQLDALTAKAAAVQAAFTPSRAAIELGARSADLVERVEP